MSVELKLYELSDGMNNIAALMEEGTEGLQEAMDILEGAFHEKVEGILKLKRSKEASAAVIKTEIERLQKLVDKHTKDAQWLNDYVEREMLKANKTEVKGTLFTAKLQMTPSRVEVSNVGEIPIKYMRYTPATSAPDKNAIKEAIQGGVDVPGCRLEQSLKLKVR